MIEKRKQVELLDRVGKAVNSPGDLDQVLALAVETARAGAWPDGTSALLHMYARSYPGCPAGVEG